MHRLFGLAPLIAAIWRRTPGRLRGLVTWTVTGKVIVGVSGVLLDGSDRVLLARHRFHSPKAWGLPGGWLNPGESVFCCWRREVKEELNLDVAVDGILFQRAVGRSLEFYLVGRICGGDLQLDRVELLEANSFGSEELRGPDVPMTRLHRQLALRALGGAREAEGSGRPGRATASGMETSADAPGSGDPGGRGVESQG